MYIYRLYSDIMIGLFSEQQFKIIKSHSVPYVTFERYRSILEAKSFPEISVLESSRVHLRSSAD